MERSTAPATVWPPTPWPTGSRRRCGSTRTWCSIREPSTGCAPTGCRSSAASTRSPANANSAVRCCREPRPSCLGTAAGCWRSSTQAAASCWSTATCTSACRPNCSCPLCHEPAQRSQVPFFQPLVCSEGGINRYLPDDYAFCEQARRCGYRVHADSTLRLSRLASYAYSWEEADTTPPRYARFDLHLQDG